MYTFVPSTILDAVATCGVNDIDSFNGMPPSVMFTKDIYGENFESCKDNTFKEFILTSEVVLV